MAEVDTHPGWARYVVPVLILLLGAGLRFHALGRDARFHPDEALYNTFARDAAIKGDWLLSRPLDKPPLMIYANALAMTFTGVSQNAAGVLDLTSVRSGELAGRLPNTLVSILLLAVFYALAQRLYHRRRVAAVAMLLVALSPFAVAFSATAFTDVFMVFWVVVALWMAARDRWGASGFCLALGLASKQPALLYLPLILMTGWTLHGLTFRRLGRFITLFALGAALLLVWDASRGQPTIWQVSAGRENYPDHLAALDELIPRLAVWLDYARWLVGPGWLTAALSLLAVTAALLRPASGRTRLIDRLILLYVVGYGLLHWWVAFNTFDRYLLPLLPALALPAAHGLDWFSQFLTRKTRMIPRYRYVAAGMLLLAVVIGLGLMFLAAKDASEEHINVGADLGQDEGIDQLAAYLNSKPVATVVYDHWLGWELEYYMGPWSDKRRVYYPAPDALVADALRLKEIGPRYLPAPKDAPVAPWVSALKLAGFAVSEVYDTTRFIVYQIIPPPADQDASSAGSS